MSEFPGVVTPLAQAISARGYETLTSVQSAVLAPELADADLLVSAQTGSGKTVAFGMAIAPTLLAGADRFAPPERPLALVIAPTRELALQVKRELDWLYADTGAVIASCVGGMDPRTERRVLERGVHIVVGTPGRLCDHLRRRALDTGALRAVILDEADEMLDMGFREELEFILEATPEERRTLLFSATVAAPIAKLAKRYQRDAVRVSTKEERAQHSDIDYRALVTMPRDRENAIINVLRYHEAANALVFCNTRAAVNRMVSRFGNRGFSVVALSGELSQNERNHALQALRDGRAQVCIATDVAARGIDLPDLELVIHADLPSGPETLLHRSGRTGRAGRKGVSALMVDVKAQRKAERLLQAARVQATWGDPPSADDVIARDEERMLADPILTDEPQDFERDFAARLLERFTAEQIATAFLRLTRAQKSAPEDIEPASAHAPRAARDKGSDRSRDRGHQRQGRDPAPWDDAPRERQERQEFAESLWLTLSVGRKQNAEPRWLIPLLCNGGDISKRDIGVIKMQQTETHVQLNAEQADKFLAAIGPNRMMEKNIRVTILDGRPDLSSGGNAGKPQKGPKKKLSAKFHAKPDGAAPKQRKSGKNGKFGPGKRPKPGGGRAPGPKPY
ncbi:DEAD/DEAH box helicase [Pacificimonas sp. WHA3]|uniref:DEAD/DEAH box helicase n=1 Tax=Pacificimonas pallii TaxID=2827236 RepID=A0ABS6SC21_9SPHN|nr:DEAD/DEAH box helicase [Pacificimonas pallii]MBV7255968.1 DEAD/DEAH box helicase [Pacificimonas pallii]